MCPQQTDDQVIADLVGVERSDSPSWTQSYGVQNQGQSQIEAESNSILSRSEIEPDTTTILPGSEGSVPPALETQSDAPADVSVEGESTQEIASQTNVEPSSQESGIALLDITTPPRVEESISELTGKETLSPPVVEAAVRTEEFSTAPIIVTEDSQVDVSSSLSDSLKYFLTSNPFSRLTIHPLFIMLTLNPPSRHHGHSRTACRTRDPVPVKPNLTR